MRSRTDPTPSAAVAIVSNNPETLDGLQAYLSAAGVQARVRARSRRVLEQHVRKGARVRRVPRRLRLGARHRRGRRSRATRPAALPVLVTAHPKRFETLTDGDKVLVVPRPVWGWTILDAIRAHLDGVPLARQPEVIS